MLLLQCICIHSTDIGQCQNLYSHVVQYCSHSKSSPKEGRRNYFSQPWPKHFKFASYRHEMGVLTAHTDCCYYPVLWWHHKLLQYSCGVNQAHARRSTLRVKLCLWINLIYPLLQCQIELQWLIW